MAGIIKDVGMIDRIDARIIPAEPEESSPGEAVAGRILTGLGLAARPLSLPPQVCANKPMTLLGREGVSARHGNRCTLGRSLDNVFAYGGDTLCSAIARAVCPHDGMDRRWHCLDTTRVALTRASVPETDAPARMLTHGSAKDHRPDVQQTVLEVMVSHEGGVPFLRTSGDGHAAETTVFQERGAAWLTPCNARETPRSLIAAAQ